MGNKAGRDGVILDVMKDFIQLGGISYPVVKGFVLPECFPAFTEYLVRSKCRITLQSLCDFLKRRGRADKEMNMIRHDDVRQKPVEMANLFPMMECLHDKFGDPRIPQPVRPETSCIQRMVELNKSEAVGGLLAGTPKETRQRTC